MTDKCAQLRDLLIAWRAAERAHAQAVLCAWHPDDISKLADELERAMNNLRVFVDSEPWPEL